MPSIQTIELVSINVRVRLCAPGGYIDFATIAVPWKLTGGSRFDFWSVWKQFDRLVIYSRRSVSDREWLSAKPWSLSTSQHTIAV